MNRLEQEQNDLNEKTQESTLLQNLIDRLPYNEKLTAEGMLKWPHYIKIVGRLLFNVIVVY